jgi:modulator of FtsH protease HflK
MPWSDDKGGPWGPKPKNPWAGGDNGPGSRGPRGQGPQPDIEDLLRKAQESLKNIFPGYGEGGGNGGSGRSGGGLGAAGVVFIGALLATLWGLSGWYRVNPDELGVEMVFGKFVGITPPGLNYNWPAPVGQVLKPKVTAVNRIDVGLRNFDDGRRSGFRDVPEESLMLTGDENIVDVDFTVFWRVRADKPQDFLFNVQNPEGTIKAVAESAMREVVGRSNIQPILTGARQNNETAVQELMQKTLDQYNSGVEITQVQLQKVDPPMQVIDSFRDVQAARADQERLQNEAQAYANRVVPEARGEVSRITQGAEAYRERTVAESKGQTARFLQVLEEYRKAPDVTRQRMYLETMERILGGTDKIILDQSKDGSSSVVPYLPLDQLLNKRTAPTTNQGAVR